MPLDHYLLSLPAHLLNPWGYVIVFLAALVESVPPIGFVIPGGTIVVIGGFLAKLQVMHLRYVLLLAILGAIIGDIVGYYLGKTYGYPFIIRCGKYFFMKKSYYDKTKKLMNAHAGKTLLMGRLNSVTRPLAPFVAGATELNFAKFMFYNIVGGIMWGVLFTLVGFIFGQSYQTAAKYLGLFVVIAIVLSLGIVYGYKLVRDRKHIIGRFHLYALILNIASIYIFFKMLEDVVFGETLARVDIWVSNNISQLWNPFFIKLNLVITTLISPTTILIASVFFLAYLVHKRMRQKYIIFGFTMLSTLLLELFIKEIVARARPENAASEIIGYSFPSAHAALAFSFFALLIYFYKDRIKVEWKKWTFIFGSLFLIILVGFTRIYLNVHWVSDVIAGYALALFCITFSIIFLDSIIYIYKRIIFNKT